MELLKKLSNVMITILNQAMAASIVYLKEAFTATQIQIIVILSVATD